MVVLKGAIETAFVRKKNDNNNVYVRKRINIIKRYKSKK